MKQVLICGLQLNYDKHFNQGVLLNFEISNLACKIFYIAVRINTVNVRPKISLVINNYIPFIEIKNLIKNVLSLHCQYKPILPVFKNCRFLHAGFYCTRYQV